MNEITGTDHDGLCEECNEDLTEENLTEGDLGFYCSEEFCFYCSEECREEAEDYPFGPEKEDFHADI